MRGQLGWLTQEMEVAVASHAGDGLELTARREGVRAFPVRWLKRQISPLSDLAALAALVAVMRRFRPHVVNASTPKAGLLGMVAGRIAGVPVRVYTLRGLRWETLDGPGRRLLRSLDRVAFRCAHRVVCVSPSLRDRAVEEGLLREREGVVLGDGSSNGVDVERFRPADAEHRRGARRALGIPEDAPVVGFVGRLTRDKGIAELFEPFAGQVSGVFPEARLLIAGDFEEGDPLPAALRRALEAHPRVVMPGFVDDAAPCYAAMDVLAFPSHREGFPNAPLEAASSGVPTVGFAVTGTVDAVVDGETGVLVPRGDVEGLGRAVAAYLRDPGLREAHGRAARRRAVARFRQEMVWQRWAEFYRGLLREARIG